MPLSNLFAFGQDGSSETEVWNELDFADFKDILFSSENASTNSTRSNSYNIGTATSVSQARECLTTDTIPQVFDFNFDTATVPMRSESDLQSSLFHLPMERGSTSSMSDCEGRTDQFYDSVPNMYRAGPYTFSDLPGMQDFPATPEIKEHNSMRNEIPQSSKSFNTSRRSLIASLGTSESVSDCSSTSQSPQPRRNSRQSFQHAKSEDFEAKSLSKKAHSLVERRYRVKLNGKMDQLRLVLSEAKMTCRATMPGQDDDYESNGQYLPKIHKSDVLLEAVNYVQQSELDLRHMADEIARLSVRVRQLEDLAIF